MYALWTLLGTFSVSHSDKFCGTSYWFLKLLFQKCGLKTMCRIAFHLQILLFFISLLTLILYSLVLQKCYRFYQSFNLHDKL